MTISMLTLEHLQDILQDLDDDFNVPLIIGLSAGLGVLFIMLLILTVYFTVFSSGGGIFLGSSFNVPGEFDDVERMRNEEEDALPNMSEEERQAYLEAREFQEQFPPQAKALGSSLTETEQTFIDDRGIQAYHFEHALEQSAEIQEIIIEDKLEVRFTSSTTNSAILNYPLPIHDNDTVYFEVKLYEMPSQTLVSIGLATKPYPLFRLPGHNRYSISYESDGTVRVNQPFYSPSIWNKLVEGDVVGCGFKPRSGTIFFTHNGKRVAEASHNVKFDMYPIIGSTGPSKLSVNLGQIGFVFIEANVKKWGFGSVFGTIGVPPAYGKETGNDTVLDKGEELPPNYPSEEETFFGPPALLATSTATNVPTLATEGTSSDILPPPPPSKPSKIISKPPSYSDEPKTSPPQSQTPETSSNQEVAERLYERRSSTFDLQNNEYDPLASNSDVNLKAKQTTDEALQPVVETQPVITTAPEAPAVLETTQANPTAGESTLESTPELTESPESTPEPENQGNTSTSHVSKPRSKHPHKNKKKGKKKGRK